MLKIVVDRPIFASAGIERPNRRQYYNTMSNSINPYESPQANVPFGPKADAQPNFPACSIGLMAASVLVGALVTASAIYFIYVDDPRTGTRSAPTLEFAVSAGAALSSVIWLVSGFFQRRGIFGLIETFIVAALFAGGWILMSGTTYADVLGAASCVGWPIGGLVASIASYRFACRKFSIATRLHEKNEA